jgi:DNA-directed RNA polymerase specialized sigma24 family protein
MKAPLIVDALRARDPGAPAALYDTHGESLFRYCWFILRNRDAAQVALRDALVVAETHIGQLPSPDLLRPWLYAIARAECQRRQQSRGAAHDAVIARPDQPDADRRLIGWHAVMSLEEVEREALELTIRHGMDNSKAALVLHIPSAGLAGILERASAHLEQALAGEILARHGVHGCLERAEALRGWAGELTVPLRERLVNHARSCDVCGRYLPRNVSAAKVFSLLPLPVPPQAMRLQVMTCFSDPELVGYRMFVAARVTGFNQFGFPDDEAAPAPPQQQRRVTARAVWSGPAAAAVAVAVLVAAVFAISRLGGFSTPVQGMSSATSSRPAGATPTVTQQPGAAGPASPRGSRPAAASRTPGASGLTATRGAGLPTRLYLRGGTAPNRGPVPGQPEHGGGGDEPGPGQLQVSPSSLVLGPGSTGQLTLTASGGPVTWSAVTSSSDITLSSSGGTIAAGQQVTVTVSITRAQNVAGQGTITIGPGGATVPVSWSDPATSPPPPSGSPSPTVIHSSSPAPPPSPGPPPSPTPTQSPTPTPTPTQSPVATFPGGSLSPSGP